MSLKYSYLSMREDDIARKSNFSTHFEICFENMSYFLPVIEPERAKLIMKHIQQTIDTSEEIYNQHSVRTSEVALIFAIQATSFIRAGQKIIATKLYEKTRDLLVSIFDLVGEDLEVAACYGCLTQYFVTVGDVGKATFFMNNATSFLNNVTAPKQRMADALAKTLRTCAQALSTNENITEAFANVFYIKLEADATSQEISNITDKVLVYLDSLELPPTVRVARRIYVMLLSEGLKIQKLRERQVPINNEYLDYARKITKLVSEEYFSICQGAVAIALKESSLVYMELLEQTPSTEFVENLKENLRGLNILSERHGLIRNRYYDFITSIKQRVELHDIVQSSIGTLSILNKTQAL
jgi:hypothetical protein